MSSKIYKIIEYLLVFFALFFICLIINDGIVIKGLFMDDLYDWSWFRGTSYFDFALKFYPSSKYRPVFESAEYLLYMLVGTNPMLITFYNKLLNAIIALFIYYFVNHFGNNRIKSFFVATLYLFGHYSYYQISQGIGNLESVSLLLSIMILFFSLDLVGCFDLFDENKENYRDIKKNRKLVFIILILFFLLVFTHERYIGVASTIFLAILFAKKVDSDTNNIDNKYKMLKFKILSILSLILEFILIIIIRFLATNRIIPAGTGGTYVEKTFYIGNFLNFAIEQVKMIFGINIGPEHLVGIEYNNIADITIKNLTVFSNILIFIIIAIYFITEIYNIYKKKNACVNISVDLLFLSFIGVCIASSSVTIRIEMRFVYVSFTAAIIYLSYMCSYIKESINSKFIKFIFSYIIILVIALRLPIEMEYRRNFDKIYCFVNQQRMNSIYENTIAKFGLDDTLHNKKIYIINKYFGMTDFYAEYYFKIFDKTNVGNIIILLDDPEEIKNYDMDKNSIVLYENIDKNEYEILNLDDYRR